MDKKRKPQWQTLRWLLLLVALSWPALALAHGSGTPRLVNVLAGPYRLWVWSLPDPIRVGETHISVAVEEATPAPAQQPAATAFTVQLTIQAIEQANQQLTFPTSKQERFLQTYYEADFTMPTVGEWQATVNVSGPAGIGTAAFTFAVLPPQRVNWELVTWSGVMVIAIIWAVRQNHSPAKPQC